MSIDSFGAKGTFEVGENSYEIFRLSAVPGTEKLPYALKVLAENLLRTEDGANITARPHPRDRELGSLGPAEHRDPVHPGARDHAGLHRRALRRRPRHHA